MVYDSQRVMTLGIGQCKTKGLLLVASNQCCITIKGTVLLDVLSTLEVQCCIEK